MIVVIDASVALSWTIASQSTLAANTLLRTANAQFVAPFIYGVEVRNALLRAERQGRLSIQIADEALQFVASQLVALEPAPDGVHLQIIYTLAREERLSFFDAFYLESAQRGSATLATRDGALLQAAQRRNVAIYDAR